MFGTYREQYERMMRWYRRFDAIDKGRVHDANSFHYDDEVHAFFQNCYHLKDWIKNDPAQSKAAIVIEDFVTQSQALSLCADICNGLKHLSRNRGNRSGENPQFGKRHYAVTMGEPTMISAKYEINTASRTVDAFTLATECISEWDTFIQANC